MMRSSAFGWMAVVAMALAAPLAAVQAPRADVTGAWTVTITRPSGDTITGLAILSQDGSTITGMIGPGQTEMMPAEGTVAGNTITLLTRPRTGRTAAFARCDLAASANRMTGTVDTDKATVEFVRRQRPTQPIQ